MPPLMNLDRSMMVSDRLCALFIPFSLGALLAWIARCVGFLPPHATTPVRSDATLEVSAQ